MVVIVQNFECPESWSADVLDMYLKNAKEPKVLTSIRNKVSDTTCII